MYLSTFKSYCLRVWLLISLNLDGEIFLFGADRSCHILGAIKNIRGCLDKHKGLRDNKEQGQA